MNTTENRPTQPTPNTPNEGQSVRPSKPVPVINPTKPATNTDADLDKSKKENLPNTNSPERH